MRNGKFINEVEELIDIAHNATSGSNKRDLKQQIQDQIDRTRVAEKTQTKKKKQEPAKRKSRLTAVQKAFILSEILPRKY